MTRRAWIVCALLAVAPTSVAAQSVPATPIENPPAGVSAPLSTEEPATASREPAVDAWLSNWTRAESWRFFDPPVAGVNPDYTFVGNRADLGVRVRSSHVDLVGAFSYVRVENLPRNAIGPGGLGTGAFYFAASGLPYSYQVFLTDLTVAAHTADRRLTFTLGRMSYTSGAEGERPLGSPASKQLTRLRQLRLDGRVLGNFDWSFYGRRFDGMKVEARGAAAYGGGGAFLVTQGGYEESASLTMPKLQVASAYAGLHHGSGGESQVFAVGYRDRREIDIRPDNAAVPVESANVTLVGVGASHLSVRTAGAGEFDWLAWSAGQGGDWYGQRHRAFSAAAEAGYRWSRAAWRPWLRAGASYASGDDNPDDDRHGTYFPMLQDTRTYALSMVYAQMNLRDVFAQVLLEPHPSARVRFDVHRVALASAADRWYQGSGATARAGRFFGYSTRSSSASQELGTVLEGTADVRLSRYWSVNGYAGHMWGGAVVRGAFAGHRLFYWYVENVLRLALPR
jgi:hypothetical protein